MPKKNTLPTFINSANKTLVVGVLVGIFVLLCGGYYLLFKAPNQTNGVKKFVQSIISLNEKNEMPAEPPSTVALMIAEPTDENIDQILSAAHQEVTLFQGDTLMMRLVIDQLVTITLLKPDNADAKAMLANAYLTLIAYDVDSDTTDELLQTAKHLLDQSLALEPDNFYALHSLFNYHSGNQENAEAVAVFLQLQTLYPDSLVVRTIEGRLANRNKQYQQAITIADEVLNKNPSKIEAALAFKVREFALEKLGLVEELDQNYQRYLSVVGGPWLHQAYAIFLSETRHDYEKALEVMRAGLAEADFEAGHQTLFSIYFNQGIDLFHAKNYEAAFLSFDNAVAEYDGDDQGLRYMIPFYQRYQALTGDSSVSSKIAELEQLIVTN